MKPVVSHKRDQMLHRAAEIRAAVQKTAATPAPDESPLPSHLSQSLARVLRPQAAYRWLLPQLASITPQYIEMTLRAAIAGDHVRQWELFDLMEDTWPRLGKNLNELKNGVRNMKMTFTPYAEEGEDPTDSAKEKCALIHAAIANMKPDVAMDENSSEGTVFDILDGWGKGVTVLETDWHMFYSKKLGTVVGPRATFWVHPVCYAWSTEGQLGLRMNPNIQRFAPADRPRGYVQPSINSQPMPQDILPFPDNKFLVGVRKHKSGTALAGAMLRPLAWWWCAANFSADWLLNLAQTFGLPFRWANYDPNVPQATIDAICNMLQNMGSSAWAAFPAGTTLDLKEAGKGAEHSPQADMLDRSDKNCDLIVLGQTLTSDVGGSGRGGGSLALGKVHSGVKDEIIQSCARYAANVYKDQLFPAILALNYGETSECPTIIFETEKEEDLVQKSQVIANLAPSAGKTIPLSYINDAFNIPKPVDGEPTLADASAQKPAKDPESDAALQSRDAKRLRAIMEIKDDAKFQTALVAFAEDKS